MRGRLGLDSRAMMRTSRMNRAAFASASVSDTGVAVPPAQQPLHGDGVAGLQVPRLADLAHGAAPEYPEKLEPSRDHFRAVHCPPISRHSRHR